MAKTPGLEDFSDPIALQSWFVEHVTLMGEPYFLDRDQATAVLDKHQNCLVTARAGSGKTRVIVAKIAYLVATGAAKLSEIAAFMFNRAAAAEVNQRIRTVRVDGRPLVSISDQGASKTPKVASTFHKFALDTVKLAGENPQIISERDHVRLMRSSLDRAMAIFQQNFPPNEYNDILKLTASFIARAGQRYTGREGLAELTEAVETYLGSLDRAKDYKKAVIHQLALTSYIEYLKHLKPPFTDFNLLMSRATKILEQSAEAYYRASSQENQIHKEYSRLKYLLVDEYQDFSYLFYALILGIRAVAPQAKLFAVGDDWQAINRFAGSDVDYFIKFAQFFPENCINIPLLTNYRSDKMIVEYANDFMIKHYATDAKRATAFSKKKGEIHHENYAKCRFDATDIREDALGDGRFQKTLLDLVAVAGKLDELGENPEKAIIPAAKLLKLCFRIINRHPDESIMLLHRHNFTSIPGVDLPIFNEALKQILARDAVIPECDFAQNVRCMTMHKSKGLESDIVILLEFNHDQVLAEHPFATMFQIFGDDLETEKADQYRLIYVALTRAKHRLYILSSDDENIC